jgi:hypothetical protein
MTGPGLGRIIGGAGEEGDGKALAGDRPVAVGGDVLSVSAGTRCGKDCTQDMRVFLCNGNEVLRLLVLRWLLLDCREGDLCGICNGTMLSLDLWILGGLLEVFDAVMLSSSHVIIGSIEVLCGKQERKGSSSQTLSP